MALPHFTNIKSHYNNMPANTDVNYNIELKCIDDVILEYIYDVHDGDHLIRKTDKDEISWYKEHSNGPVYSKKKFSKIFEKLEKSYNNAIREKKLKKIFGETEFHKMNIK